MRRNFLRQLAAIETTPARGRDVFEGLCLPVQNPFLACAGRTALWREVTREVRLISQYFRLARPTHRRNRRNKEAIARITDRGNKQFLKRQLAKFFG